VRCACAVCDDDAATNARHSRPTNGLSLWANPTPRSLHPRITAAVTWVDAGCTQPGARDGRERMPMDRAERMRVVARMCRDGALVVACLRV